MNPATFMIYVIRDRVLGQVIDKVGVNVEAIITDDLTPGLLVVASVDETLVGIVLLPEDDVFTIDGIFDSVWSQLADVSQF
jgi:hypothetical protein